MSNKPKIGISSCLLGEKVRYDGDDKKQPDILQAMLPHFELVSICPEVAIGLGVPRETIQLIEIDQQVRCVGSKTKSLDVTDALTALADQHRPSHQQLSGYIFKRGSPSCGLTNVKLIKQGQMQRTGTGLYAKQLRHNFPDMPLAEETQLTSEAELQAFINAVFAYHQTVAR